MMQLNGYLLIGLMTSFKCKIKSRQSVCSVIDVTVLDFCLEPIIVFDDINDDINYWNSHTIIGLSSKLISSNKKFH